MLFPVYVSPVYIALVGVCAGLLGILGLTGILSPRLLRRILKAMIPRWRMALLGVALLLVGVLMVLGRSWFDRSILQYPPLGICLGVLTLLKGMFWLLLPGAVRRLIEFHVTKSDLWQRLLGVACLVAALLFVLAADTVAPGILPRTVWGFQGFL